MLGTAGVIVRSATGHYAVVWPLIAVAAAVALAGVGITRRSLVPQVLARGAAWLVLLPTSLIVAAGLLGGRVPGADVTALAAATGAALLLSRPMLHTKEAKAAFAPKVFRRWLLAGSIATAASGLVAGAVATATAFEEPALALGFGALAASLLASAIAVVRMRAWGIFLGALSSVVLLVTSLFLSRVEATALAVLAAPTLLMHLLPVLVARWTNSTAAESKVRVSDEAMVAPAYVPAHHRIALDDLDDVAMDPAPKARAAIRS